MCLLLTIAFKKGMFVFCIALLRVESNCLSVAMGERLVAGPMAALNGHQQERIPSSLWNIPQLQNFGSVPALFTTKRINT